MLTYDTLGTPSCQPTMLNAVQVPGMVPMAYQYPWQTAAPVPFQQRFPTTVLSWISWTTFLAVPATRTAPDIVLHSR